MRTLEYYIEKCDWQRERIVELEAQNQAHESYAKQVEEQLRISKARIEELEAENKMLHRSLAAKPDTATSSGAAQAAMEYEIDLRERRIKELEAEQQRRDLLISEAASARAAQEACIKELAAENTRIVAESKQCHETNDGLCSNHMELRKRIKELEADRNGLRVELGRWMRIDAENHARLNAVLNTEVPLANGKVKVRQFKQVQEALGQKDE